MEKRILRPDGFQIWVELTLVAPLSSLAVRANQDLPDQDISDRKAIEERLESERSKAVLLQGLPVLAIAVCWVLLTMQFVSEGCNPCRLPRRACLQP